MSKRAGKNFNANVKCRDLLIDLQGLSDGAAAAFMKFWMHHHLHGVPLPPREEQVDDVDEYFRDLLGMKNVRTWRKARDELVGKARLRVTDEGRFYMRRTMREVGREDGPWDVEDDDEGSESGGGSHGGGIGGAPAGGQGRLPLMRVVGKSVDQPVDGSGEVATSGDVCPNIEGSSGDVCPNIGRSSADVAIQPIENKRKWVRPFIVSSSPSHFDHEFAAALMAPPRARGDPGQPMA